MANAYKVIVAREGGRVAMVPTLIGTSVEDVIARAMAFVTDLNPDVGKLHTTRVEIMAKGIVHPDDEPGRKAAAKATRETLLANLRQASSDESGGTPCPCGIEAQRKAFDLRESAD